MIRPFSGRHLGPLVSEVADDHLVGAERRRALAHLAACPACCAEVEQERRARRAALALPPVGVPPGLCERLAAGPGEAASAPWAPSGPPAPRRRAPYLAVAGVAAVAVGAAALVSLHALGAPPDRTAASVAGVSLDGSDVSGAPLAASAVTITTTPAAPVSPAPRSGDTDTDAVTLEVVPVGGATALVARAHGKLVVPAGADVVEADGRDLYGVDGWWVTQVGQEVVAVRGDAETARLVLESFPEPRGAWGAFAARVDAGWRVLLSD